MSAIHTALVGAMHDICKIGIGKTQKNVQQGYQFRGVEQAMNEMSPIMVNHGITVASSYCDLAVTERAKAEGKATRFVTLKGVFTFTAEDDSSVVSEAYGEAMDSGDKAVIKAQSVAFRTALFQLFVVPTMSMDSELSDYEAPPLPAEALEHAERGMEAYTAYFKGLTKEGRIALAAHHDELKAIAEEADKVPA